MTSEKNLFFIFEAAQKYAEAISLSQKIIKILFGSSFFMLINFQIFSLIISVMHFLREKRLRESNADFFNFSISILEQFLAFGSPKCLPKSSGYFWRFFKFQKIFGIKNVFRNLSRTLYFTASLLWTFLFSLKRGISGLLYEKKMKLATEVAKYGREWIFGRFSH